MISMSGNPDNVDAYYFSDILVETKEIKANNLKYEPINTDYLVLMNLKMIANPCLASFTTDNVPIEKKISDLSIIDIKIR